MHSILSLNFAIVRKGPLPFAEMGATALGIGLGLCSDGTLHRWYCKVRELQIMRPGAAPPGRLKARNRVHGRLFSERAAWLEKGTEQLRADNHPQAMAFAHMAFSCFIAIALAGDHERCSSSDDVRIVCCVIFQSRVSKIDRCMLFKLNIHQHRSLRSLRESPGAAELDASS